MLKIVEKREGGGWGKGRERGGGVKVEREGGGREGVW